MKAQADPMFRLFLFIEAGWTVTFNRTPGWQYEATATHYDGRTRHAQTDWFANTVEALIGEEVPR